MPTSRHCTTTRYARTEALEHRLLMAADPAAAVDNKPPTVEAVYVNSTQWSPQFRAYLADHHLGSGQFGYETDKLKPDNAENAKHQILPWINLNQVSIRFSENVQVQQDDLTITSVAGNEYHVTGFTYDPETFTATWTLDRPVPADILVLNLDGTSPTGVTDLAGNLLKGNTSDGDTGGGAPAGRDYEQALPVLPGDVNRSGSVLADDFAEVKTKFFASTTSDNGGRAQYDAFHDVDGSGNILANDFAEVKKRFFSRLPSGENSAPFA
jgi:hypothetical protein